MDRDRHDRAKRLGWFDMDKVSHAKVTVVGWASGTSRSSTWTAWWART
jgi:hypothetical protein